MPMHPVFVGRDRERARVDALLEPDGAPPFVLVEGEAGIGKTRLVREVVDGARGSGTDLLVGGAEVDGSADAFALWRGVLRQLGTRLPPAERGASNDERRWEVWELLADHLPAGRPLVVLEDLHWADDESLWVLGRLTGELRPAAVLATARPPGNSSSGRWMGIRKAATVIGLGPLSVDDVGVLLQEGGRDPVDAAAVHRRTGGNPLLVHEVLTSGGEASGSAVLAGHLRQILDDLGPAAAATVRTLALGGPGTPVAVVASARGVSANQVVAEIARAVQADVLRTEAEGVVFRHDLLRESLVQHLGRDEQAAMHLALAEAWAVHGAGGRTDLVVARHRLAAAPSGDVDAALDDAGRVGVAAMAAGRLVEGLDLLDRAAAVARSLRPGDPDREARLLAAAVDARWNVGDLDGAGATAARAVALAEEGGRVETQAAAVVAAVTHHNPFDPDPVTVDRLGALAAELEAMGADEPAPLLIRVLGRQAIMSVSLPGRHDVSRALGDRAVALARRLGDPVLLVAALRDRHFAPNTPADLDQRHAVAAEILDAARTRPDLGLVGHEWKLVGHLSQGELRAAEAALDDFALHARLMSAPSWRYSERLRRVALLALQGRTDEALQSSEDAYAVADGLVMPLERLGLRVGTMHTVLSFAGTDDPQYEALHTEMEAESGHLPLGFIQLSLASGDVHLGRRDVALRRIAPWRTDPDPLLFGPEGVNALMLLAEVVVRLGDVEAAPPLIERLRPFAGRIPVANGMASVLVADIILGRLHLLRGESDTAVRDAQAGLAFARASGSAPTEAHALALLGDAQAARGDAVAAASARDAADAIAERFGMNLARSGSTPDPAAAPAAAGPPSRRVVTNVVGSGATARAADLRQDADGWHVECPYGSATLPDSVGMAQLARLLERPGSEVTAAELAGGAEADAPPPSADLGPALDARAKREYRRRISELQADIDEADDHHDLERSSRAREELDLLLQELRRSVGLGGRDRPQGSGSERARINVTRNLRRAIRVIEQAVPELGAHLAVSVRTGHRCAYAPEPAAALGWTVERR